MNNKPLFTFNLKREWYDKIASGEKRTEYREAKAYWHARLSGFIVAKNPAGQIVRFRLGYTKKYMDFIIVQVRLIYAYEQRDLRLEDCTQSLYAIDFEDKPKEPDDE
jgi:hypothetical protein